jgi:U3 small nucleolar RNA-associated protein 19
VCGRRVQFFQLADIFLSSGMVPAYTAAAFAKKFGRLALRAPPAGAMLALGFMHNIIRRHPACMVLLHKPRAAAANVDADGEAAGGGGLDVFDESQADPARSRAVESSLWELAALRNHYWPQVMMILYIK